MRAILILISLFAALPALANPCMMGDPLEGRFAGGDADGFEMAGQPETFVLAGLADPTGPVFTEKGVPLRLYPASPHLDRYGRAPVFAFADGVWLQADALARGATADPMGLAPPCAAALLKAEPAATAVPAAETDRLNALAGRFVAVTGLVRSVGDRERRLYLNFGTKWDEDFTISVAKTGRSKYRGDLDALKALEGRTITVRGALDLRGGPLIRLRDEARISIDD